MCVLLDTTHQGIYATFLGGPIESLVLPTLGGMYVVALPDGSPRKIKPDNLESADGEQSAQDSQRDSEDVGLVTYAF